MKCSLDVRFRRPARGGDRLTVVTQIEELRGASSTWRQEIRRGDEVLLVAEITAACTTPAGRPTRTPTDFQAALAELARLLQDSPRVEHAALCYRRLAQQFGDVVCREGKTGKELVEALPADGAVRKLLDAALPGGTRGGCLRS